MLMMSGHDSTISADQVFLIRALGLNENETYIYPKYASQLALEVRTKNDTQKKSSYSDYYVVAYFDVPICVSSPVLLHSPSCGYPL